MGWPAAACLAVVGCTALKPGGDREPDAAPMTNVDGRMSDGGSLPPVPDQPGRGITAGGNVSRSPLFKLVGAVGKPPGSMGTSRSPLYTFRGGVVAVTR
jgi:hypothetical protein